MRNSPLNSSCPFGRHFNLKLSHSTFQVLVKTISGFHDNRDTLATFDASKASPYWSCKEDIKFVAVNVNCWHFLKDACYAKVQRRSYLRSNGPLTF